MARAWKARGSNPSQVRVLSPPLIMSSRTKALMAIIGASLLWSTAGVSKIVVREFDPFTAAFIRFAIASIVILPIFLTRNRIRIHTLLRLVPLSLLSTANIIFFYLGVRTSTANAASMIYAGVPLVTMLLAQRFINEKITHRKIFGILIGLLGVLCVAVLPSLGTGETISGDMQGNIFYLCAVAGWSLYIVGSRKAIAQDNISPLELSAAAIFTSTVVFSTLALFFYQAHYTPALTQPNMILLFLYLGIFITVVPYLLFQWAIKHSSATTPSLKQYLEAVFSVLFNILFLGEVATPGFVAGSALVFIGLFATTGSAVIQEARLWLKR